MDKKVFRILVVDDEKDVRNIMINYLSKKLHAEVTAVGEGDRAVEAVKAQKPDLVLLDLHLPGKMGCDILREIRRFDTTVKVIMVTAIFSIPPEDQEFILEQTSGYMTKPIELDTICSKVVEVLGPAALKG